MTIAPHEIYHSQMTEAKLRILATERVLASGRSLCGLPSLDSEFCFLQMRKVIEIVTFSGMVREEHRYRQLRKAEKRKPTAPDPDPSDDWNAKKILSKLVLLSPYMLPIPLGAHSRTEPGVVNFDRAEITVNHGRLIELYEVCSGFMHSPNPLVENYKADVESQRSRYRNAPDEAKAALLFLRQLLWLHAAVQLEWTDKGDPTSADNPTSAWIVDFSHPLDDVVNVTLAVAQEDFP
jgi:hypothetical protein